MRSEMWCNLCEVIVTLSIVGEDFGGLVLAKEDVGDLLPVAHFLCTETMAPQRLNLWSNGDGCHRLSRFLDHTITGAEKYWIMPRL